MLEWRAKAKGADILMFPELQVTGYPPEDLVLKPEFVRRSMEASERLIDATAEPGPAILFGSIHAEEGRVYNAYMLADDGKLIARRLKRELPNYGTFDEKRVFASGPLPEPVDYKGVRFGIPICEDIWLEIGVRSFEGRGRPVPARPQRQPVRAEQGRDPNPPGRAKGYRNRASDRLSQPRRRPGRTGVRRRELRHQRQWQACRALARFRRGDVADRHGAAAPAAGRARMAGRRASPSFPRTSTGR